MAALLLRQGQIVLAPVLQLGVEADDLPIGAAEQISHGAPEENLQFIVHIVAQVAAEDQVPVLGAAVQEQQEVSVPQAQGVLGVVGGLLHVTRDAGSGVKPQDGAVAVIQGGILFGDGLQRGVGEEARTVVDKALVGAGVLPAPLLGGRGALGGVFPAAAEAVLADAHRGSHQQHGHHHGKPALFQKFHRVPP